MALSCYPKKGGHNFPSNLWRPYKKTRHSFLVVERSFLNAQEIQSVDLPWWILFFVGC